MNNGRTNQAHINGSIAWPRGKMLGGSGNMNAMFYVKGNDIDYQHWSNNSQNWTPEIVRKYFKKAESYQYQHLLKNPS